MPFNIAHFIENFIAFHCVFSSTFNSRHDNRGLPRPFKGFKITFGIILKPLYYAKLNSEHILLVKDFPKMPLNGHKWPWNGRGRDAARCSSKSEWIVSNTHIMHK